MKYLYYLLIKQGKLSGKIGPLNTTQGFSIIRDSKNFPSRVYLVLRLSTRDGVRFCLFSQFETDIATTLRFPSRSPHKKGIGLEFRNGILCECSFTHINIKECINLCM